MDKNMDNSIRALTEVMFNIQMKSDNFMHLLTYDEDLSENLVLLLLRLKLFRFLKVTEISEAFLVTPGAATNMCDKLERLDFIERIRLKDDRRVVRITLTKKGEERVDKIFSKFSIEDLENITNVLSEVNILLNKIEKNI